METPSFKPVNQVERFKTLAEMARQLPPDQIYTGKGLSGVMHIEPGTRLTNAQAADAFEQESKAREQGA